MNRKTVLILSALTMLFFFTALKSCNDARMQKIKRDQETVKRLDLEEKMNDLSKEKAVFDEKLKGISEDLEAEKDAHQATKRALLQEQLVNQSLKEELQKITKLKEALEEDLKDALISHGREDKIKR